MPGPFVQRGPQPRAFALRPRETWEREHSLEINTRLAKRVECTWWSKSFTGLARSDLGCLRPDRWTWKRSLSLLEGKNKKKNQVKTEENKLLFEASEAWLTCCGCILIPLQQNQTIGYFMGGKRRYSCTYYSVGKPYQHIASININISFGPWID